jgi:hypothetical protein
VAAEAPVGSQETEGAGDEVVEIEAAQVGQSGLVGDEGSAHRAQIPPPGHPVALETKVELEPADGVVQPSPFSRPEPREQVGEDPPSINDRSCWLVGGEQDLPAEGVEGADPDGVGWEVNGRQDGLGSLAELPGSAAIEGDQAEGVGGGPLDEAPEEASDEGGGLAAPRRRDAEEGTRRSRGCGSLVWRQAGQELVTGAASAGGEGRTGHGWMMPAPTYAGYTADIRGTYR